MGDDDTECCGGFTLDVTVGEATITLHTHGMVTPETLDTFLARITWRATAAEASRFKTIHAAVTAADKTNPDKP